MLQEAGGGQHGLGGCARVELHVPAYAAQVSAAYVAAGCKLVSDGSDGSGQWIFTRDMQYIVVVEETGTAAAPFLR
ncbi:hypothetical protein EON62_02970, partial [archaeon]